MYKKKLYCIPTVSTTFIDKIYEIEVADLIASERSLPGKVYNRKQRHWNDIVYWNDYTRYQ